MTEKKGLPPTEGADQRESDDRATDDRSSLDRLAEFTRRILRVRKEDLPGESSQKATRP